MKTRNLFDPKMLDMVLSDGEEAIHEVAEQIEEDKSLVKVTQNSAAVDIARVYDELGNLISTGNCLLQTAKYAVDTDPTQEGVLAGTASLLSVIKDVMKEFTKIHMQNIKFQQQKELELIKQNGRKDLIELKNSFNNKDNENYVDTLAYTQEQIVKQIMNEEDKEKMNEED